MRAALTVAPPSAAVFDGDAEATAVPLLDVSPREYDGDVAVGGPVVALAVDEHSSRMTAMFTNGLLAHLSVDMSQVAPVVDVIGFVRPEGIPRLITYIHRPEVVDKRFGALLCTVTTDRADQDATSLAAKLELMPCVYHSAAARPTLQ